MMVLHKQKGMGFALKFYSKKKSRETQLNYWGLTQVHEFNRDKAASHKTGNINQSLQYVIMLCIQFHP